MRNKQLQFAEIKISYKPKHDRNIKIKNADDAYQVFKSIWDNDLISIQEQFYAIFLNNSEEVIGYRCIHTGSSKACLMDIKLLLSICCKLMSEKIIIAHNHPSGNLKASQADYSLTYRIRDATKLLDIQLLEHLIITSDGYDSVGF